jgi:hypothetical protein
VGVPEPERLRVEGILSTYGGFWLGLGAFVVLSEATKLKP